MENGKSVHANKSGLLGGDSLSSEDNVESHHSTAPILSTSGRDKLHANERAKPIHSEELPNSFWKLFLDNWIYVVTYCLVFGSFGVCVGFLGPTVFDLGCQTHSSLWKMNWVFFVQLMMTLVGSISAGFMASR